MAESAVTSGEGHALGGGGGSLDVSHRLNIL